MQFPLRLVSESMHGSCLGELDGTHAYLWATEPGTLVRYDYASRSFEVSLQVPISPKNRGPLQCWPLMSLATAVSVRKRFVGGTRAHCRGHADCGRFAGNTYVHARCVTTEALGALRRARPTRGLKSTVRRNHRLHIAFCVLGLFWGSPNESETFRQKREKMIREATTRPNVKSKGTRASAIRCREEPRKKAAKSRGNRGRTWNDNGQRQTPPWRERRFDTEDYWSLCSWESSATCFL